GVSWTWPGAASSTNPLWTTRAAAETARLVLRASRRVALRGGRFTLPLWVRPPKSFSAFVMILLPFTARISPSVSGACALLRICVGFIGILLRHQRNGE